MWIWIPTIFSILASTFRSLNWGYQKESYMVSVLCCIPFLYENIQKANKHQAVMNGFYMITASIGAYRWSLKKEEKSSLKKLV